VLLAQAIVVAEVIALIVERVEGLIFNPPVGTATTHDFYDIVRGDLKIAYPAESVADKRLFVLGIPPSAQGFDRSSPSPGFVERHGVNEAKTMRLVGLIAVGENQFRHFSPLSRCIDLHEHVGMISGLVAERM